MEPERFPRVLPPERRLRLVRDELDDPPERRDALLRADPRDDAERRERDPEPLRDDALREDDFRADEREDVPREERLLDFRAVLLRDEAPLRDRLRDDPPPERLRELELDLRAAIGLPPPLSDDMHALRVG